MAKKKKGIAVYKTTYEEDVFDMAIRTMPPVDYTGVDVKDLVLHKMLDIDKELEHKFKSEEDVKVVKVLTRTDIIRLILLAHRY